MTRLREVAIRKLPQVKELFDSVSEKVKKQGDRKGERRPLAADAPLLCVACDIPVAAYGLTLAGPL